MKICQGVNGSWETCLRVRCSDRLHSLPVFAASKEFQRNPLPAGWAAIYRGAMTVCCQGETHDRRRLLHQTEGGSKNRHVATCVGRRAGSFHIQADTMQHAHSFPHPELTQANLARTRTHTQTRAKEGDGGSTAISSSQESATMPEQQKNQPGAARIDSSAEKRHPGGLRRGTGFSAHTDGQAKQQLPTTEPAVVWPPPNPRPFQRRRCKLEQALKIPHYTARHFHSRQEVGGLAKKCGNLSIPRAFN